MVSNDTKKKIHRGSLGVCDNPFQRQVTDGTENGHDFLGGHRQHQNSLNLCKVKMCNISLSAYDICSCCLVAIPELVLSVYNFYIMKCLGNGRDGPAVTDGTIEMHALFDPVRL